MEDFKDIIPGEFLSPSEDFRSAMGMMGINWWYWDVKEKRLMISPELMKLLGYTPEEFDPGVPTLDKNIHPDDSKKNIEVFTDFIKGELPFYEMYYRLKHEGKWKWFYNRGAIVKRDDEGNPLFAGGITMGISGRYDSMLKKAEEGSKFEFLFKYTNQAVLIVDMGTEDKPGTILEANDAAYRLIGLNEVELIGKNPYEIIDESFYDRRAELRNEIRKKGRLHVDLQIKDKNGNLKYLDIRSHAFSMTGQELFVSIITDKTETHKARKDLAASELALRQSEKVYRSLIKAANDRIGLFETDGTPALINNAFYETLGFTEEEYKALEDKERIHPDDKVQLEKLSGKFFRDGSLSAEYRVQHKDGHYLHMNSRSVLLQDSDLEKDYVLFIIRDVTDKVEFGKKLISAKEKAEESDLLKSAFLANMSHEIRTPMNSIVGFANLLSEEDLDKTTRALYATRINRNSEQLLALVSDIIDLAKIESNQLSVLYTIVYPHNLFSELMQYGRIQLEQRSKSEVDLVYDPDPYKTGEYIETDLIRLTQVLQNLLNNAIKFTSSGKVSIGFRFSGEKIRFYVRDTGTGIDRKNFDIIFDQFRQVDGSHVRRYGGTGLGLAICKNLASLLKGKIWVESEPGEGSVFYLELPVRTGMKIEEPKARVQMKPFYGREISAFVADDDPDSLFLLKTLLRREGVKITTTDTGYSVLELLEREDLPDLVLLDLQMPVLSGEQTMRIIKEKYPSLKVIAQSARAFEGEREKSMVAGFDGYISKPYDRERLLEVIRHVLAD